MFGLSLPEMLLIVGVVLIVFGPEQLPEIARKAGRIMGQVRGQLDSVRREFYNTVYTPSDHIKDEIRDLKTQVTTELKSLSTHDDPLCPDYKPKSEAGSEQAAEQLSVDKGGEQKGGGPCSDSEKVDGADNSPDETAFPVDDIPTTVKE